MVQKHLEKEESSWMSTSRRSFVRGLLGGMVTIALAGTERGVRAARRESFSVISIVILSRTGPHRFRVELAETPLQRMQGLQGRQILDAQSGMLFVFDSPTVATMWMKDTYISLDMLFLDEMGGIVAIAKNTQPMSLQVIRPPGPAKAVLEVSAGTAERLGIEVGHRVLHPVLGAVTSH